MKKINLLGRKLFSSILAGLLVCSFVLAPISSTLEVQKAEAVVATLPLQILQQIEAAITTISSGASASGIGSLAAKDYIFDTIAWGLINLMLQQMIRSVTQWVNSGFQGSPAFVQDLGGFLTNIADQYAGNFIYGSGLKMLCSPFKLNIQLALDLQYRATRGSYQSQCRLSSVVNNVEKFIGGDFIEGGWNGWYEVALNPKSNPYNTMLDAQASLTVGISSAQGKKSTVLSFGNGFLSKQKCEKIEGREICKIVTPGNVIQSSLNSALNIPNGRLVVADELNELVGALFSQLASKVLSGVGGLLGLTGGGGSNVDYFDQISKEHASTTYGGAETQNPMPVVLERQKTYLGYQNEIKQLITEASLYKETIYGTSTCSTGNLTPSLIGKLNKAIADIAAVMPLIANLQVYSADYALLRASTTPPSTITALLTKYGVTTTVEAESKIMTQYSLYSTSGSFHTDEENVRLRMQTITDLKEEIKNFTENIDKQCDTGSRP